MRNCYIFLTLLSLLSLQVVFSQKATPFSLEASLLRGNAYPHTDDMHHLINGHPSGFMLSVLQKTDGSKEWHQEYNYPDFGGYFLFQNFQSEPLGSAYAVGAMYNFYFLNRKLQLKISQGFAVTTNPYDKETNSKNKAFGSTIVDNTNFGLSYSNQTLFKNSGFHAGLLFSHYSNGRIKSPNSGINTILLNVGVNYNFNNDYIRQVDTVTVKKSYKEAIRFNVVVRSGVNESIIIGSGQMPFYHIGFYADKRLNRKSRLQLGTELFLTQSIKEHIRSYVIGFPEKNIDPSIDYKRVGVFFGHELIINKMSLEAQIGYYVYQPFKKDIPIYNRVGMKYYFTDHIFGGFTIKTHLFLAEALEFGIGYRI